MTPFFYLVVNGVLLNQLSPPLETQSAFGMGDWPNCMSF